MAAADAALLARARGRTPADPAVRACWDSVVLGILSGVLAAADVRRLVDELPGGRAAGFGPLTFEPVGDELRVSHVGHATSCPTAAMCAELARLVADPVDVAALTATPIGWVHAGDPELPYRARVDGRNLLVRASDQPAGPSYTLVVDGADRAVLQRWPPAWRLPPAPRAPQPPAGTVGIARLRVWSERLCRAAGGDLADMLAALGIAGTLRGTVDGSATVESPPPGTARIDLSRDDRLPDSVSVAFSGARLTRADFDTYFGHGGWMPRIHWDSAHKLAYHVEVPGAPATCAVFPSFAEEPTDTAVATGVTLRIDRSERAGAERTPEPHPEPHLEPHPEPHPAPHRESHREELLRVFKIGEEDIRANRRGMLGVRQRDRLRRGIYTNVMATALIILGLVAIVYFLAERPIAWWRYALIGAMVAAGAAVGFVSVRRLIAAFRAGVVECLAGPVRVTLRGRTGMWLAVQDRSFRMPVRFWHVGNDRPYRVYVAPAARAIVAMEPDGWG